MLTPPQGEELFFASAPLYTEDLLEQEIRACGGQIQRIHRTGIHFTGSLECAYRLCLWARVAGRVFLPLWEAEVKDPEDLYRAARDFPWNRHLSPEDSFALETRIRRPDRGGSAGPWTDERYCTLKLKDGLADYFTGEYGRRPGVNTERPDILFALHLRPGPAAFKAVVSLDLSGGTLHKRGYRAEAGEAPLKEDAAAVLLLRSGWPEQYRPPVLLDPFCGSGTILIEGALMACDMAPGLYRSRFGFEKWKLHNPDLWNRLKTEGEERRREGLKRRVDIRGFDKDPRMISFALANIRRAGLEGIVRAERRELSALAPPPDIPAPEGPRAGLAAANPPYGVRLGSEETLLPLYRQLGDILKERFSGWTAAILCSSDLLSRSLGIKPEKVNKLFNGPLPCSLCRYVLFSAAGRTPPGSREIILSPGAQMFFNRLAKNARRRFKWARKNGISCFRLYDADMPEYAAALDCYEEQWLHVQEYAPPAEKVDPRNAERRRREIQAVLEAGGFCGPAGPVFKRENIFFKTRDKQKGKSQYAKLSKSNEKFIIREGGLKFFVNFNDYLDPGIFLDHRKIRGMLREAAGGKRFLNLFCYTGTATVYAAAGGALLSDSVDTGKAYLEWAQDNLRLNGLYRPAHQFIRREALEFLATPEAAPEPGRSYDLIFADPPTFSNSTGRPEDFDVQRDHLRLLQLCLSRLAPGGEIYFSNNFRRFKLDEPGLEKLGARAGEITGQTASEDFGRRRMHRCWKITRITPPAAP
ncbi:MAG: bifunctional 23S rRNA (guanine(2069)-N(7))-methyltransferase RlmK/23S rRNA (guanine(2445)-N(2))-methyltransferase RlmL [Spirochaetales bacterium]|jgi:23S rRNA (guanine2445-N2)-methyltransferase / 23S rRNA (guanine2069-N7)-methyltransferase|nr:bifunctional 23S rRNA (guanine(2069)-N(7))-methyltransferase RlmK/23S rRNA (guanine(2445)-N(2))-methyltransferase RlmL [Spirochaetales bacterium]